MSREARIRGALSASPWSRRVGLPLGVLAAAALLGACEGGNLFEGGRGPGGGGAVGTDREPPVVDIQEPGPEGSVPLGDSLLVAVRVRDNRGVAKLTIEAVARRGDPDLGTLEIVDRFQPREVELDAALDTVVRRFLQPVTTETTSEQIFVIATATDSAGLVAADTVQIFLGAARVEIRSPINGQQLQAGRELGIRLFAVDRASKVTRVELAYSGVVNGTFIWNIPQADSVVLDTTLLIPTGTAGQLTLVASATNGRSVRSSSTPVVVTVQSGAAADTAAPTVQVSFSGASRVEITDTFRVTVTAQDNNGGSGLLRIGFTALAVNTERADTAVLVRDTTFTLPRTGTSIREFRFVPFHMDTLALPDTIALLMHAYAIDASGNCAAAVSNTPQRLPCGTFAGATVAAGANGLRRDVVVAAGRTIRLPGSGGVIADAVVDTGRQRLYLSNFTRNKVELLDLTTLTFLGAGVAVGSQPWGMFLNRQEDTLMVANSGGTNVSFVHLGTTVPAEDRNRRLRTPNAVLFDVDRRLDETGAERYTSVFYDFSDRPQFLVQDSTGRLLYSTEPTPAAGEGTVRLVDEDPVPSRTDDEAEIRILFTGNAIAANPNFVSIAHIDSLRVYVADFGDLIELFDHVPGYPDSIIRTGPRLIGAAIDTLASLGSDIFATTGGWRVNEVGLSDTTYLAASGDRGKVLFGEGGAAPFARVMMWHADQGALSGAIPVTDLINNASERVLGVGLNQNGSLGVLRGSESVAFFTPNLRLQGRFLGRVEAGGAGAALHPGHDSVNEDLPVGVSFVGTGNRTIQIIDTFHFFGLRELHIRDNVIGPLRTSRPLPSDNAGLGCPGNPNCVVVKLYGITDVGGVVIVNVREKDLQ